MPPDPLEALAFLAHFENWSLFIRACLMNIRGKQENHWGQIYI